MRPDRVAAWGRRAWSRAAGLRCPALSRLVLHGSGSWMRCLPMRCARPLIVGFQRAIEVDDRRTVSTTSRVRRGGAHGAPPTPRTQAASRGVRAGPEAVPSRHHEARESVGRAGGDGAKSRRSAGRCSTWSARSPWGSWRPADASVVAAGPGPRPAARRQARSGHRQPRSPGVRRGGESASLRSRPPPAGRPGRRRRGRADDERGQALAPPAVQWRSDGREVPVGPSGAERRRLGVRASTASSRSPKRAAGPSSSRVRRASMIGVRPGSPR